MKIISKFLTTIFLICINFNNFYPAYSDESFQEPVPAKQLLSDSYLLGPGDKLKIDLKAYPQDSIKGEILNDGTISIPFLGAININKLSLKEAKKKIQAELSKELIRPEVEIILLSTRNISVLILGDVNQPGYYTLQKSNSTLVDSIKTAGGFTPQSNLENISLKRKLSGDDNRYKQKKVNLVKLLKEGDINQNPYLFDGDIIKVEKVEGRKNIFRDVANSNLSGKISVNIIGEVFKSGKITISPNTPLNQAIFYAGGPKGWRSQKGYVKILRINSNSTISSLNIRANLSKNKVDPNNPLLKEGDTIFIRKSPLATSYDTLRTITRPLGDILLIDKFIDQIDD